MTRSSLRLAAISAVAVLTYCAVTALTPKWMMVLFYPIWSLALTAAPPVLYLATCIVPILKRQRPQPVLFWLSTVFLLLSAFLRFDAGDDTAWFGTTVLGFGEFALEKILAWPPLLNDEIGILFWNMFVCLPLLGTTVLTLLVLRTPRPHSLTRRTHRLSEWQRLWAVCTVLGIIFLGILYPSYSALKSAPDRQYSAALEKDFRTPACTPYIDQPLTNLREPSYGDGNGGTCWHLYTSRLYDKAEFGDVSPYGERVYQANVRKYFFIVLGSRIWDAMITIVVAASVAYALGILTTWVGRTLPR